MNEILLCATALVALFYSCEEETYERIDRKDWTKLQVGDTLFFHSPAHVDTFLVRGITTGFNTSEKINHTEYLEIYYLRLNIEKEIDTLHSSWYGTRRYPKGATIQWNRFDEGCTSYYTTDTIMDIGNIRLNDVIAIPERSIDTFSSIDTKTVYYCNRYGVVQYKLFNGEIFTIDYSSMQKLLDGTE